jgi:PAS domain S-box-containing protein
VSDDLDARLRIIFDAAAIGIVLGDVTGRVVAVNPALQRWLGYDADEIVAIGIERLTHPDDFAADLALFTKLHEGVLDRYEIEKRYVRKDGRVVWGRLVVSCSRSPDGRPELLVGMVEDIDERRRAEEALALSEQRLHQSQKLEALGRLSGGIAHDFNNLLTVVLGNADVLARRLSDPTDRTRAEEIREAATHGAHLTRRLLAFSRQQVLAPRVIDLSEHASGLRSLLARLLGEESSLSMDLAADLAPVRVDPVQIEQVLLNLVVNARDAMPEGGTVSIDTHNEGDRVVLTVSDTGAGMDAETLEHVFDPFFTTKPRAIGGGLGLAIVHGIVTQSDGRIDVSSEPGRGTTFRMAFPCAEAPLDPPAPAAAATEPARPRRETVLLVEDDAAVRRVATDILSRAGHAVLSAAHPDEALRLAAEHGPAIAIVVTDVVMPGTSGPRLADRLAPLCPRARVLYVSGYTDHAFVRQAEQGPRFAFLHKPFTQRALTDAVRAVLDAPDAATLGDPRTP